MEQNYSQKLQVETRQVHPGLFVRSVHRIYHEQFRRWFGIMAPTTLIAGIILVLADQGVMAIMRAIAPHEFFRHYMDIWEAVAIRIGGFFLSWLLGAFALAAIATAVNNLDAEHEGATWSRDSYQRAREHLGSVVALAAITFFAFAIGAVALGFVETAVARRFGGRVGYNYAFVLVGYVAVASIVAWLGAAIPLILRGDTKIRTALKRSVELSNGYEGALFLLVVESVAGSFIAWYVVVHGLPWLLPPILTYSSWCVWILNLVGVLASAAVEPPLFIGFSLLANPERFEQRALV